MHWFDEHHSEFKGFSLHYHDTVRPGLLERDAERAAANRKGMQIGAAIVVLGVAIFIASFFTPLETVFGFFAVAASAMGAFAAWYWATDAIRKSTKNTLMQSVVGYIGWRFDSHVASFDMRPYKDNFLLPAKHDRHSFEDSFSGDVHGARFDSVEAHLEKETRDSDGDTKYETVFRGQLMRIDFPTRTFGRTVVLRDKGWFNAKTKADMKRVGLASPKFEKLFEAYGTDQVEARVILDPAFMQRMIDLETAVSGKNIRFAFCDNDLLIAVETPNQFEAGSMRQSLDNPGAVQKILDEVGTLYDIVDGLVQPATRATSQAR